MIAIGEHKTYEVGFIGGGYQSAVGYTHKIASHMDNCWKLVAGCFSQDIVKNKVTASQWGVPQNRLYENWQELLEKEKGKLDAIVILSPTPEHLIMVVTALEAGFPVICEKSLACSVEEIHQIKKVLKQKKGFLAVTYNYSGYPMLRELKDRIEKGVLGKITQMQIEMPQEGFIRLDSEGNQPAPQPWRLVDGAVPTVSLDLGSHVHHIAAFLTGETPQSVVADQASYGWFNNIVDSVMCMVRYTNNMQCQMWYGKTALGHRNGLSVRLYGDKAAAEWTQSHPEELYLAFQNGDKVVVDRASNVTVASQPRYNRFKPGHPSGFMEAFANLYMDIAFCLEQYLEQGDYKSPYVYGLEHALEGMHLFEAINQSAKTSQWVNLPEKL